jgi:hypothetical protein
VRRRVVTQRTSARQTPDMRHEIRDTRHAKASVCFRMLLCAFLQGGLVGAKGASKISDRTYDIIIECLFLAKVHMCLFT